MTKKQTLGLMLLAVACTIGAGFRPAAATGCAPAPTGLISWWPGAGNAQDIKGSNDGTLQNGTTFASGKVGQAFSFDGVDDRIGVADSNSLKLTQSLTIEGWISLSGYPGQLGMIMIRGDDRGGLDPYYLAVRPDGRVLFHIESLTESAGLLTPVIPLNQFVHLAATLSDSTGLMRLYVNGVKVDEATTTVRPLGDLDSGSNPSVGIGNHGGYPGTPHNFPFHGFIDELSIYNRALSASQIRSIYDAGSAGKCLTITKFVTNINDSGPGSLRAAINFANNNPGTVIKFRIPREQGIDIDAGTSTGDDAPDVFVIQLLSALPALTSDNTFIDGATQAAFVETVANRKGPEIVLDGSHAGLADGLAINAAHCKIRQLVITNFVEPQPYYVAGIRISGAGAHHNIVEGCYIGVDAAGASAQGNTRGVQIENGAHDNIVGGTTELTRNLIIGYGNEGAGVEIRHAGTNGNIVQGNYIGTNRTGTAVLGTGFFGVLITHGAQNNIIGGTGPAARNVIAAQSQNTVAITFSDTNVVQGNYISTNAAGTDALGSGSYGMVIYAGSGNTIGGTTAAARNVISGNHKAGVLLLSEPGVAATTNNIVQGNYIGINASGRDAIIGNQTTGVAISGDVHDNVIGRGVAGGGNDNFIAFNKGDGVRVYVYPGGGTPTRNTIRRNAIYKNGGLGINLQPEAEANSTATPNDEGDSDTGPNNLQNFPVLTDVTTGSSTALITGGLKSTPGTTFKIDLYLNQPPGTSDTAPRQHYLSTTTVTTNGNGRAELSINLSRALPVGASVTATATSTVTGDTSEFSRARLVTFSSTTADSTKVATGGVASPQSHFRLGLASTRSHAAR